MARRACLVTRCLALTHQGESYCPGHTRERQAARNRARTRTGDGARQALRKKLNAIGFGVCASCLRTFPASHLEVDHRVPLVAQQGRGRDVPENLQLLCTSCHRRKSAEERKT